MSKENNANGFHSLAQEIRLYFISLLESPPVFPNSEVQKTAWLLNISTVAPSQYAGLIHYMASDSNDVSAKEKREHAELFLTSLHTALKNYAADLHFGPETIRAEQNFLLEGASDAERDAYFQHSSPKTGDAFAELLFQRIKKNALSILKEKDPSIAWETASKKLDAIDARLQDYHAQQEAEAQKGRWRRYLAQENPSSSRQKER